MMNYTTMMPAWIPCPKGNHKQSQKVPVLREIEERTERAALPPEDDARAAQSAAGKERADRKNNTNISNHE